MRSFPHQFLSIVLHASEEGTAQLHIPLIWIDLRPLAVLFAIRLWHHPTTKANDTVVLLRILRYEGPIGWVVETDAEGFPPPLSLRSVLWRQILPERCIETWWPVSLLVNAYLNMRVLFVD